jgi:hypothetical protein
MLHEISKGKANWIGHILHRNWFLRQIIKGKIKWGIGVTVKRGWRRRKLLDDLKERRGYSHLKEEALDRVTERRGWRRRKLLDDLKERRGYSHLKEEALDRVTERRGWRRRKLLDDIKERRG